jgi:DNA polymerase-3 subunit epsilon
MNLKSIFKTGAINWPEYYKKQQDKAKDERLVKFYQQGLVDPQTPLNQVPFVAVDFETTGLDPKKDGIISIGLVPFTLSRVQLNRATHWIVNPDKPLDEESVVIHGITHSDIIDAPDLTKILEDLLEALAGTVVVVHYRKIEREFLDLAVKNRLGEGLLFPVLDTLALEADIQRKQSRGLLNILKGKKPESVRLGSSRTRYGLPAYTPHHALTDAIATAELLQAQIAHHYSVDTPIQKLWK